MLKSSGRSPSWAFFSFLSVSSVFFFRSTRYWIVKCALNSIKTSCYPPISKVFSYIYLHIPHADVGFVFVPLEREEASSFSREGQSNKECLFEISISSCVKTNMMGVRRGEIFECLALSMHDEKLFITHGENSQSTNKSLPKSQTKNWIFKTLFLWYYFYREKLHCRFITREINRKKW